VTELHHPSPDERTAPVSVIIPAYNGERFIRAAIESVQSQTLSVAEIIVVDDGSSDRTYEIASDLGVRVIRQSNQGVSAARNVGIQAASQPWIALLDADDMWDERKIEFQWAAIEKYPAAALVYCHISPFLDPSCRDNSLREHYARAAEFDEPPPAGDGIKYYPRATEDLLATEVAFCPSTATVRRDAILAAGLFDQSLHFYEDYECFLRVLAKNSFLIVERPLVNYRVHDGNCSHNRSESSVIFVKLLDRLNQYPEKYPEGAARALDNPTYWPFFLKFARALLDEGRMRSARFVLGRYLKRTYSNRAIFLWCLTLLGPNGFKSLLAIKRSMQKTWLGTRLTRA
jgi:glycosyltransferase involved in cell wall biosynthesis